VRYAAGTGDGIRCEIPAETSPPQSPSPEGKGDAMMSRPQWVARRAVNRAGMNPRATDRKPGRAGLLTRYRLRRNPGAHRLCPDCTPPVGFHIFSDLPPETTRGSRGQGLALLAPGVLRSVLPLCLITSDASLVYSPLSQYFSKRATFFVIMSGSSPVYIPTQQISMSRIALPIVSKPSMMGLLPAAKTL
jgi:hypothetical protein